MIKKLPETFKLDRYGLQTRFVEETDAEFILTLRSDKELNRHISSTPVDLEAQRKWIQNYKEREKNGLEYYFIFSVNNIPQGVARIYNIDNESFTQGSWIFSPDSVPGASILGNIISSEIGFEFLEKSIEYSDARRSNNTHRFVKTFDPEIIQSDEQDIYYKIYPDRFERAKHKHIELASKVLQTTIQNKNK